MENSTKYMTSLSLAEPITLTDILGVYSTRRQSSSYHFDTLSLPLFFRRDYLSEYLAFFSSSRLYSESMIDFRVRSKCRPWAVLGRVKWTV